MLHSSYWFIPAVLGVTAGVLAWGSVWLDRLAPKFLQGWTFAAGPDGARAVLSAIAGSIITVTGVVFSVTIVALTMASSQFGPRLLRSYIRDRRNQVVLGIHIATFIYSLLVLRTVDATDNHQFVPEFAVSVGIFLAVVSLGALIFFIHHVAQTIQVNQIIQVVNAELLDTIDKLFPAEIGRGPAPDVETACADEAKRGAPWFVPARRSGYVVTVDGEGMLHAAREHDVVIEMLPRPGGFLVEGDALAAVRGKGQDREKIASAVREAFVLAGQRTAMQDVLFCVEQLAQVAVRALSPSINDPYTAVECLDHLSVALCRMAERDIPSPCRYDQEGNLRVIGYPSTFPDILGAGLSAIRENARGSRMVLDRLLEVLAAVAKRVRRPADREAVRHHAGHVAGAAKDAQPGAEEVREVERRHKDVLAALERG